MKPELACQQPGAHCERRAVRTRDGVRVCLFHPKSTPPALVAGVAPEQPPAKAPRKAQPLPIAAPQPHAVPESAPTVPLAVCFDCTQPLAAHGATGCPTPYQPPELTRAHTCSDGEPNRATCPACRLDDIPLPTVSPLSSSVRCLLVRGEQHRNRDVQRAARTARQAVEQLASTIARADRSAR